MNLTDVRKIASELKIAGRSKMNKAELIIAIGDLFFDEAVTENRIRVTRKIAAGYRESNAKPRKGAPMGSARRKDNYCRQNGCERLTAAQRRRLAKKAIRKLCNAL